MFDRRAARRRSRLRLSASSRAALGNVTEPVALVDERACVVFANAPLGELLGTRRFGARRLTSWLWRGDRAALQEGIRRACDGREKTELRLKLQKGHAPLAVLVAPWPARGGCWAQVSLHNLKPQQDLTDALASGRLNRAILHQASEALLLCDERGVVLRGSAAALRLIGAPLAGRALDRDVDLRLPSWEAEGGAGAFLRAVLDGKALSGVEGLLRPDGRDARNILLSGRRLLLPSGETRLLLLMTDVTELKKTERALRRSEDRLRQMNAELERRVQARTRELTEAVGELDAFAYSIAHDLRAPLRSMHAFGEFLLQEARDRLEPDQLRYVERIIRSSARMDELIRSLLDYARLAREGVRMEPVELRPIVERCLAELEGMIRERQAEVGTAPKLPRVRGSPVLLLRTIENLVANALTYVARGVRPVVCIGARRENGRVLLCIADNGIGIPPEHRGRIFGIFERLHGSEAYPGSGVGLAIVKRCVERMNGRVWVESGAEGGSLFYVELPEAP